MQPHELADKASQQTHELLCEKYCKPIVISGGKTFYDEDELWEIIEGEPFYKEKYKNEFETLYDYYYKKLMLTCL